MDYKDQIDQIITQALTDKTFSLEVIEKIRELKINVENLQSQNKELEKSLVATKEARDGYQNKLLQTEKTLAEYKEREEAMYKAEKASDKLNYELEFQKQRANEIKELVGLVFRNPVLKRSEHGNRPIVDNNNYVQSGSMNSETMETIE